MEPSRFDFSSLYKKEDWWAVWIGLLLFVLSLPAYKSVYLLGWVPAGHSWTSNISQAITTKIANPWVGLVAMFVFLLIILAPVIKLLGVKALDWIRGFVVIFTVSWIIWIFSYYAPLVKIIGSAESGYVFVLILGIILGNMKRLPSWIKDSARGEFFIKTAIVLLGAKILFTTFVTSGVKILGAVSIAIPVVWVVAYLISKRVGLDTKLSAVLSSGVSICGISASLATASAIEAPALYATMISSIILIFAAVEIIVMPILGAAVFQAHPLAAGVWMGLSVKTDGAASAAGSVVDGLLKGAGSVLNMAVATKVMIDIWIGLISFVLAIVFVYRNQPKGSRQRISPLVIWYRFPKFVIGYLFTSIILSVIAWTYPTVAAGAKAVAPVVSFGTDPFRVMLFAFAFFSIGISTNISKFREVGLGKPVLVYAASLLVAITVGGIVSYLFFG